MNTYLYLFFAMLPILFLIITLGASLMQAYKAAFLTLLLSIALSLLVWKMPLFHSLTAALEGALLGLWPIMLVIVSAIFTYKLSLHTKSMELIKKMLSSISTDPRIQVLVLAWGFGGFLEAISGYGTSVAIPASILIVLGFKPLFAAVICLIANTVPTAFGAVGIAVTTLSDVTGLEVQSLSFYIALQLTLFILLVPFALVMMTAKSWRGIQGVMGITLISGLAFAVPHLLVAKYLSAELPTLIGSLCSLSATILWAKRFHKNKAVTETTKIKLKTALWAWLPYIFIFVLIMISSPLFPALHKMLNTLHTAVRVYQGPHAGKLVFKWVNTPGTIILISAILGALIQGAKIRDIIKVFWATLKQMAKSTVTVVSIVAVSKVMLYSGMTNNIATALVNATGGFFPFVSPMIGTLGTFVTGSDTSSNVLFGALQKEVATSIHVNPYWLAASNTAGATAGKMISPQSIAVATSATGMVGFEGKIFNKTILFCIGYVLILGILIYIGSLLV